MSSDRDVLLSMGFDPARVDWALKATGGRGLQPAMDHILEHEGQPIPDQSSQTETSAPRDMDDDEDAEALRAGVGNDAEAKSIKCSLCGKVFKNTALANFHAEKSGHDQFEESTEEIKPLTEEEKKQKLAELKEKMAAKRAAKAAEEAKEAKANEEIRRKSGKDMSQVKEELALKQAMKEAEQRKREKIEDAKARAAIKAQIEADKKARAERTAREKALREGRPITDNMAGQASSSAPAPKPSAVAASAGTAGREYKETRLQIRMASGGQPYVTTLPSEATLREVAEYLAGQNLAVDVDTVTFAQHFPRKQFTQADFAKTLKDLGLTPSAVCSVAVHLSDHRSTTLNVH
ncbi:hypothetical protein PUNSTDRAFT_73294 [Punctularia strigosozonata HHB-11173 SS5]|uniref:uncharacterized protein n=1 Tax=Punctularia strigosozonata (strain HHB-11173) TaxID=741275 RepID=UPI0004417497|nr:uncharacterized protein PUNSTDRAFT_73294 [Punctularia strigosozonata HHB-11173 SS5]EIN06265.1 hypothetical protein PUNSTDRAFT_73294 [Punctularia strigosozonata HHB-11173 SS5]